MADDARPPAAEVVAETGLALVHAGERILPAPHSGAVLEPLADDPSSVVEYHFPVVIEVREARAPDVAAVADLAARRLVRVLRT